MTGFFRDPSAWECLTKDVVPKLVRTDNPGKPIRIWEPQAVASGEEAYTLAIMLAEALGAEGFRERVKIYATDITDDIALSRARLAVYEAKEVENVPAELRDKYFEKVNYRYAFLKEYRRSVIFGRHDLLQDAPISRIDLLVCRNTLMYFNSEAQNRILERFHFALTDQALPVSRESGNPPDLQQYVFSGRSETANLRQDPQIELPGSVADPGPRRQWRGVQSPGQPRPAPRGGLRDRPGRAGRGRPEWVHDSGQREGQDDVSPGADRSWPAASRPGTLLQAHRTAFAPSRRALQAAAASR